MMKVLTQQFLKITVIKIYQYQLFGGPVASDTCMLHMIFYCAASQAAKLVLGDIQVHTAPFTVSN